MKNRLMTDLRVTEDQWTKIRDYLRQDPNADVGNDENACRNLVDAVKWVQP